MGTVDTMIFRYIVMVVLITYGSCKIGNLTAIDPEHKGFQPGSNNGGINHYFFFKKKSNGFFKFEYNGICHDVLARAN